ncbi:MAG: SIS domain-containing protein [Ardenticatenaceae bacterium]|nr:SIS domain-containing protein [Ardenticatenaceae bacterium]
MIRLLMRIRPYYHHQSGETADTWPPANRLSKKARRFGPSSTPFAQQTMRISDGYIAMQRPRKSCSYSTKAFTTSPVGSVHAGLRLGQRRTVSDKQMRQLVADESQLPDLAGRVLDHDREYQELANQFFKVQNFLYLGRGINYPIAREGALKLKEISYIHAEGYAAGEMKHGPIALIDETMPVIAIATQDHLYEKMISQIQQAKARGGTVIAVATEGDTAVAQEVDHVIYVPRTPPLLASSVNVIPLQLFSYHVAVRRGADVDQPRNLAKSVTVE